MNLEKYGLGIFVLLTQDDNALYSTKDLGLAEMKLKEFKFDKSIHVVGAEQKLHFQQLFKTLDLAGSPLAQKSIHVAYGLVLLPEGKMSSREGTLVLHENLMAELKSLAKHEIKKRHTLEKNELEERTLQIAYGALKFSMCNRDNTKDFVFDWEKAADFEGETGPYVQYTHARICSILRKAKVPKKYDIHALEEEKEALLVRKLAQFSSVIHEAAEHYKPLLVCRYLLDLAQLANSYYHEVPVLKASTRHRDARLVLLEKARETIAEGLSLLGIAAPEEM